jgi:hypothetical protein
MAKLIAVDVLVDRPVAENTPKILEVHPENAVVAIVVILELLADFVCPFIGLVGPVTLPLTTSPRVPQLYQVDLIAVVVVRDLRHRE